jgi:hypothetical protein
VNLSCRSLLLCLPVIFAIQARAAPLPAACDDDAIQFRVTKQDNPPIPPAPSLGTAQIAIIGTLDGGATARIGLDGAWIGAAKGSTYFTYNVTPGEHHLCANAFSNHSWALPVTAEPGQRYYFQISAFGTESFVHFDMAPFNEDEGSYLLKTLSRSTAISKKSTFQPPARFRAPHQ